MSHFAVAFVGNNTEQQSQTEQITRSYSLMASFDSSTKVTNSQTGTNVTQVAPNVYRICNPVPPSPGLEPGFTFCNFLVVDHEPLLFHTGLRKMFPQIKEAVETIIPAKDIKYICWSHYEADECGSLNDWLKVAPNATPLCSQVGALTSVMDMSDKAPRPLSHGEKLSLGTKTVQWFDAPHLPHSWDTGYIFETTQEVLFSGDIFTCFGEKPNPVIECSEASIEEMLKMFYQEHESIAPSQKSIDQLEHKFFPLNPKLLANMHGSSVRGNCQQALRKLHQKLSADLKN